MKSISSVVAICLAVIVCTLIGAHAIRHRNDEFRTVSVTGSTRVDFVSDLITWSGNFTRRAPSLPEAFAALEDDRRLIREYLTTKGVVESELVFSAIGVDKEHEPVFTGANRTGTRFIGYRLSQELTIESPDVDKIENISREVTELLNRGVEFVSSDPRYYYTKLAELKIKMIDAATEDGKQRAERIATNAGATLAGLRSASLGVFQIMAPNASEEISWAGAFNTASKRKSGLVTVRLQFRVK